MSSQKVDDSRRLLNRRSIGKTDETSHYEFVKIGSMHFSEKTRRCTERITGKSITYDTKMKPTLANIMLNIVEHNKNVQKLNNLGYKWFLNACISWHIGPIYSKQNSMTCTILTDNKQGHVKESKESHASRWRSSLIAKANGMFLFVSCSEHSSEWESVSKIFVYFLSGLAMTTKV